MQVAKKDKDNGKGKSKSFLGFTYHPQKINNDTADHVIDSAKTDYGAARSALLKAKKSGDTRAIAKARDQMTKAHAVAEKARSASGRSSGGVDGSKDTKYKGKFATTMKTKKK
jgi:hypothetical protein